MHLRLLRWIHRPLRSLMYFPVPKGCALADIIIDGYNLIGIFHKNLEKARDNLIQKLNRYAFAKNHNIVLVFDGWKDGAFAETKERIGNTTVVYSSIGVKADYVINKILASSSTRWIVVSSDREISAFAEKHGSAALKSDEFEKKLDVVFSTTYSQNDELSENGERGSIKREKKGNPKKLSKINKRKMEALNKL
jgi:predicted RNA-binding protein with PIN domain